MLSETDSTDFVRNKNNHTPISWCTHRWVLNKARKQEVTGHSEQLLMYSTNVSVVALIRLFAHHPDEGYGQNVGWINEQLKFWTCCFLPWNTHTHRVVLPSEGGGLVKSREIWDQGLLGTGTSNQEQESCSGHRTKLQTFSLITIKESLGDESLNHVHTGWELRFSQGLCLFIQ